VKNLLVFIANMRRSDLGVQIQYLPLELSCAGFSRPRMCQFVRDISQLHMFSAKNRQESRLTGRRNEWNGIHLYSCISGLVSVTLFCTSSIKFCLSCLGSPVYSACK